MADLSKDDPSVAGGEDVAHEEAHSAAASLFDLRIVIAILFGIYGVVLTIMGIIGDSQEELDKAGGLAINLWTGIGMLIVAALFVIWQRLRPTIAPEQSQG